MVIKFTVNASFPLQCWAIMFINIILVVSETTENDQMITHDAQTNVENTSQ